MTVPATAPVFPTVPPTIAPTSIPTVAPTPTVDIAPTQTRAAELAQLATFTAPTAPPTVRPTPIPATTAPPPTGTPVVSSLDYAVAQQFFDFRDRKAGTPLLVDVTGDGIPDALYVSYPRGDCGRCHIGYITVLSGKRIVFDNEQGYGWPTVASTPNGTGFIVTEARWQPGDSGNNPSAQRYYTYAYRASTGDFTLTGTAESPITTRWRGIPIPPGMLSLGQEGSSLPPTPMPASTPRICYALIMTLDAVSAAQLTEWINSTWPRDGIRFQSVLSGFPSLSFWKRAGETRDIRLFIPAPQEGNRASVEDCDNRR